MIHLSVAVGRFFEALFFAILRVAGMAAATVAAVLIGLALLVAAGRLIAARRAPRRW